MRVTKPVDGMNLEWKDKKYDFVKVILKSDNSDTLDYLDLEVEVIPAENWAKVRRTTIL